MISIEFLRSKPFLNNEILCIYAVRGSLMECCQRIFDLPSYQKTKITVVLEGEEMQPDERVVIFSFEELLARSTTKPISKCSFTGIFNDNTIGIGVDYWRKKLLINSISIDNIESIVKEIEG